ncbi:MAG: hypothetical protein SO016_01205 [Lachnospiraceae bacterium]|nr:hypothetical protein [Robinsoniella sp.]MDY3765302.1 hypothetical protein [Lachnospiraceae bacterium]
MGTYRYHDGNGLYVIVAYEEKEALQMAERLFESLSYTGIGGKQASGFGRYELKMGKRDDALLSALKTGRDKRDKEIRGKAKRQMDALFTALQKKYMEREYLDYMLKNGKIELGQWLKQHGYQKNDYMKWKKYELDVGDCLMNPAKATPSTVMCLD